MRRFSRLVGCLLGIALSVAPLPASGRKEDATPPAQAAGADDIRGLWVLRTSLASPEGIDGAVHAAVAAGLNTLLVQVRGRGEAYYKSAIDPRATELDRQPPDFDPLATVLQQAHQAGLRVHAWVSLDLISSAATLPRSREHVLSRHPEWLMVPKPLARDLRAVDVRSPAYVGQLARWTRAASAQVEGLYLSPIPRESQDYSVSVIAEIVSRYAVDGVHLDYARYPSDLFDYSAHALADFRATRAARVTTAERDRLDALALKDPAEWANMFPEGWAAFRRDRLTALIQRVRTAAKTIRPDVVVSAAVAPRADLARDQFLQDWRGWSAARLLDAICPMAYTTDLADFGEIVNGAHAAAGATPIWVGIGAWQMPVNRTLEHVRVARKNGASGVLLFSYDALASTEVKAANYFTGLRQALLGIDPY
jgi:uncharacterized lipoprotein YddW (UPF0748 family)